MVRYIVPDTSALAAAFYNEPGSINAASLLEAIRSQTADAVAPSILLPEFLNVSRKKQQGNTAQGFLPVPTLVVEAVVADFLALPIVLEEVEGLAAGAWRLHQDYGIQTADAFFVELARKWQAELWTADIHLARTALLVYPLVFNLRAQPFT